MGKKTVETTASGLNQFIGKQGLAPLDTEEVTELGQYFPSSGGGSGFEPTEAQLEAMNSGITSAKVEAYDALPDEDDVKDLISDHFVAGTNVTITDNVDGTQTISSTASGGTSDYSDLSNKPSINNVTLSGNKTTADLGISEVPTITSSDDGKYLKAYYDSQDVNYEWAELPGVNEVPNPMLSDTGKVLTATGAGSYAWAASSAPTPPTAYSSPTNGSWTSAGVNYTISGRIGGYVVSNNICTVNIRFNLSGTGGTAQTAGMLTRILFTGLPKPKSGLAVLLPMNQCADSSTYAFREYSTAASLTSAGEIRAPATISGTWSNTPNYFVISGSYLVDTPT